MTKIHWDFETANFSDLVGLTITSISGAEQHSEEIIFETSCGQTFVMHHWQDCCETVSVEDIIGDINDLIGSPILMAEVRSQDGSDEKDENVYKYYDSATWTFYEIASNRGSVTIRWLGMSNGYYSEEVSFEKMKKT